MDAVRPRALSAGDTLGVIAPASAFSSEPFERGVSWLRAQGFRVKYAPRLFERHHYLAGQAEGRVADLHDLVSDPEVRAIFCARGGYGSAQMLPGINWALLAAHPLIFVGYSDMTILLSCLRDRAGWVCYHGPVLTGLVDVCDEASRQGVLAGLLDWKRPPVAFQQGHTIRGGAVEAEAVGGNLSVIASALGTPWQLRPRGRILLLEEVGERPYRVDRLVTQLRQAGVFDEAGGVAIGEMRGCVEANGGGRSMQSIFEEILGDLNIPVCMGLPFGHGPRNPVIPIGAPCRLDADAGRLEFLEPAVCSPADNFGAA